MSKPVETKAQSAKRKLFHFLLDASCGRMVDLSNARDEIESIVDDILGAVEIQQLPKTEEAIENHIDFLHRND